MQKKYQVLIWMFLWLSGVAVGWLVHLYSEPERKVVEKVEESVRRIDYEKKLKQAELKISLLEAENNRDRQAIESDIVKERASASEPKNGNVESNVRNPEELRAEKIERSLNSQRKRLESERQLKMASLTTHLNLNTDQTALMKDYLDKQLQLTLELRRMSMEGRSNSDERTRIQQALSALSFDDFAQSVLTDEQQTVYNKIQQDVQVAKWETRATKSLSQVSPLLNLTDKQKDSLYEVFYKQAQQGSAMTATMNEKGQVDVDAMIDSRINEVKRVLTTGQLELYRAHLENEREAMMRNYRGNR